MTRVTLREVINYLSRCGVSVTPQLRDTHECISNESTRLDQEIEAILPLGAAHSRSISFLSNPKYRQQVHDSAAAAVLIAPQDVAALAVLPNTSTTVVLPNSPLIYLITSQPYIAFAYVSQWFAKQMLHTQASQFDAPHIHPSAVIAANIAIPASVTIGAHVVIESEVVIGEGCQIGAGCYIGQDVVLGAECCLHPRVTLYHGCQLGARVTIHSGAVIGADGFGFANHAGCWIKIPQLGRVMIGDDVEIGANTTIDRGAFDDTQIANQVIIDNQVHIAHNVKIGTGTAIAGCVGIAGSAKIGAHCLLGGAVGVVGHITIADRVQVNAGTLVMADIVEAGVYGGPFPLMPQKEWERNAATLRQLKKFRDETRRSLKALS